MINSLACGTQAHYLIALESLYKKGDKLSKLPLFSSHTMEKFHFHPQSSYMLSFVVFYESSIPHLFRCGLNSNINGIGVFIL